MIRNILFDMGQVLIRFDRQLFLDRLDIREDEKRLLLREVFLSVEWVQMDRGTKNEATALESMCRRLPAHLHPAAEALVCHWDEPMLPVDGMYALVEELNEKGLETCFRESDGQHNWEYWDEWLPVMIRYCVKGEA